MDLSRNELKAPKNTKKHAHVSYIADTPPETGASGTETRHVEPSQLETICGERLSRLSFETLLNSANL